MRLFIGIALGAALGYAVGYIMRCSTGTCPITSNPYITAFLGGVMGAIFTMR